MQRADEIRAELARRSELKAELARRSAQQPPIEQPGQPQPTTQPVQQEGFGVQWPFTSPPVSPTALEPVATIASSIPAEIVGGVSAAAAIPFVGTIEAEKVLNQVRNAMTYTPRTKEGMSGLQTVGDLVKSGVDIANIPISGLAGIADIVMGEGMEQAGKTVQSVRDVGLGKTAGQQVIESGGSPAEAALYETTPTALLEATGLGAVRRVAKAVKPDIKPDAPKVEPEIKVEAPVKPESQVPDESDFQSIQKDIERKRVKPLAEKVMPDKEIMKAAEELGVELNPSSYSTNRAYIDVEQALKSRPGSKIAAVEEKAIIKLGEKADEMITDLGGTTNKSLLDVDIKADFDKTIKGLGERAGKHYDSVKNAIPESTQIKPTSVKAYLDKTLKNLGGDASQLTSVEKKLLALAQEGKTPTYAVLDRIRKDVGDGFKKSGVYKDEAQGTLKQVYKALAEDQQRTAKAFGVESQYVRANKLVAKRKKLEKASQDVFGKQLSDSIIPKMTSSATAISKGDASKFNKLMQSLPKARRQEAAMSLLNDIFTSGSQKKGALSGGFVSAFKTLNRNPAAKNILFNQMPKEARARFDRIGKVAEGIYRAKALENVSKSGRDIVHAMENGGLFGKVLGVGERLTPVPGTGMSLVGVASKIINKTPATQAADDFITSPVFKKAVELAAEGKANKANGILKNHPKFKKWLTTATPENAAQIGSVGFVQWLTSDKEEEK